MSAAGSAVDAVERAADALRRRRRRGHERLRARRARARRRGQRLRRARAARTSSACAPTACCGRTSAIAPRTCPRGEDVELVYSSAVAAENVERRAARERGIAERPRAELLGELTRMRRTIAVAGTHGKTTTASMLAHVLRAAACGPGWLVGAPIGGGLANAEWGEGEWLVVEADESDRSMLSLSVEIAVLTNVELDHHATFASLARAARGVRASSSRCARARSSYGIGPSCSRWRRVRGGVEVVAPTTRRDPAARLTGRLALRLARARGHAGGARRAQRARRRRRARGGAARGRATPARRSRRSPASAARAGAFSRSGASAGRRALVRGLRAPPDRDRGDAARLRARSSTGAWWRSSSRTCTRARRCSRGSSARALAQADVVVVLDVYPARERARGSPGRERSAGRARRRPTRRAGGRCTGCRGFADARAGAAGSC